MARGRKPDTADLQAAKGNPGKRTRRPVPRAVALGEVKAPAWLRKSPVASQMWRTLSPLLQSLNALTPLDSFPLARYCRYVADWVVADEAVRLEGVWYDAVGTNGEPTKKRHPAFHARHDLDKTLRELEAAFGMRPDARYKMLRDQAVVAGHGPLFAGVFGGDVAGDGQAGEATGPVGALGQFDAASPDVRH